MSNRSGNVNYPPNGQNVNETWTVCTNADCPMGKPHYAGVGQPSKRTCRFCGKTTLVEVKSQPRN